MKFQLSETIWWWIEPCGEAPFSAVKSGTLALYRDITGDHSWDDVLASRGSYYDYLIHGNTARLAEEYTRTRAANDPLAKFSQSQRRPLLTVA